MSTFNFGYISYQFQEKILMRKKLSKNPSDRLIIENTLEVLYCLYYFY